MENKCIHWSKIQMSYALVSEHWLVVRDFNNGILLCINETKNSLARRKHQGYTIIYKSIQAKRVDLPETEHVKLLHVYFLQETKAKQDML